MSEHEIRGEREVCFREKKEASAGDGEKRKRVLGNWKGRKNVSDQEVEKKRK